jgi:carbon-monoxide dehydrogenase large subunit
VSVVEVDTETGVIRLLSHTAVDDCGVVLQPTFVAGQQHGGSAGGLGQALFEHVAFDEDGNPLTGSFLSYLLPSSADLCSIDAHTMSTPTARNALGTRGIGENGCNGATAAVHNAVLDAVSTRGIEHIDLPLTPERVWNALEASTTNVEA